MVRHLVALQSYEINDCLIVLKLWTAVATIDGRAVSNRLCTNTSGDIIITCVYFPCINTVKNIL